jgi:aspartate-semialdehyde dehydrogenase
MQLRRDEQQTSSTEKHKQKQAKILAFKIHQTTERISVIDLKSTTVFFFCNKKLPEREKMKMEKNAN